MNDKVFLDTNVLVYLYSEDELNKQTIAHQLSGQGNGWISTQVMNELANVLHRKLGQSYRAIGQVFDEIQAAFQVQTVGVDDIRRALTIAERYRFSYFDSVIVATAIGIGCETLYSEDLQNERVVESSLTVKNPFREVG